MAVVILLLVCGWISIINAQLSTVSLLPQAHQSVCRGESISYNCIGNGTEMALFSPPIVNENSPLAIFFDSPVQHCPVIPNSGAAIVLVDSTGRPSFMGTLTLYVSNEQSEGLRTVSCRMSAADGMEIARNETTFSVLGAPSPVTSLNYSQVLVSSSENMTQVPVNVFWDSPDNAQEFMLQISNTNYSTTVRSLESSVMVLLPNGTYSATLCTINRCGKICRDYPIANNFSVEPQQPPQRPEENNNDSLVIALAVVVGILGLLLIVTFIYAVVVTVIICTSKKDKLSAQTIPADEMKMK